MKTDDEAALLRRAAVRARTRPEFLASVLTIYQQVEGVTEAQLRKQLSISEADWPRLELCLRPRAEAFLNDITQIAEKIRIDRGILAAVIRRVDAVTIIQGRKQLGRAGTLLAARTRKGKRRTGKPEGRSDE